MKSSSRYSLVHIASTSSSTSAPNPSVFLRFLCEIKFSLRSRAHFVDLILQKGPGPVSLFYDFLSEFELSLESRAHFVNHFPNRGAKPRKQRPSSGDHGRPLYPEKTPVFVPKSVSSVIPDRSHFPTTWWWCGWHDDWDDDVVAMMVRQPAIDNRP